MFGDTPVTAVTAKSSWNQYALVSSLGNRFPNTDVFPTATANNHAYLPSNAFGFIDEFANTLINVQAYSDTVAGLATIGLSGMTAAVGMGFTETFNIKYSRLGNSGALTTTQPFTDVRPSPRMSLQVGNLFKHQAYVGLDLVGAGNGQLGIPIVWYYIQGYPSIEYCSNCRFKMVYLSHGSVVGTDYDTATKKMYVQLLDRAVDAPAAFNPTSKIMVWSSLKKPAVVASGTQPVWQPQIFKIKSLQVGWRAEITIDSTSPAEVVPTGATAAATPQIYVTAGDFFVLFEDSANAKVGSQVINIRSGDPLFGRIGTLVQTSATEKKVDFYGSKGKQAYNPGDYGAVNPWILEDPALMHEYELIETEGIHTTAQQNNRLDSSIVGLWAPPIAPADLTIAAPAPTTPPSPTRVIGVSGDLAFGNIALNQTKTAVMRITNTGSDTLDINDITLPTGFTSDWDWDSGWDDQIEPSNWLDIEVTFAPVSDTANYYGQIVVDSNATAGTYTIYASGNVFTGNTAYADPAAQSMIWLPPDIGDAKRRSEWVSFGGTMKQGATKLITYKPGSVQLILSQFAAKGYQNFAAGCLVGEYLIFDGLVYPILAHTRDDSVTVQSTPVNGMAGILPALNVDSNTVKAGIFQRNYWMINEMYPGDPTTPGAAIGLWSGPIDTVVAGTDDGGNDITTVVWKTKSSRLLRMSGAERTRWGVDNLDLRMLIDTQAATDTWQAYESIKTVTNTANPKVYTIDRPAWLLRIRDLNESYPLRKLTVSLTGDVFTMTAQVKEDFSTVLKPKQTASILFDEPYARVSSGLEASFSVQAEFKFALGTDLGGISRQTWSIATSGWYDCGRYVFSSQIDPATPISLVDFSFGYDPVSGYYAASGSPAIFATTRRLDSSMTMCRHRLSGRQHIFFDDPDNNSLLVMRSADTDWVNQIEQIPICVGYPTPLAATAATPADADLVLWPTFKIPPEEAAVTPANFSTYWLRYKTRYFQSLVSGQGGLNTPLFRQYGLVHGAATSTACHFPFEFYPPTKLTATANVPVMLPAYLPSNAKSTDVGLVKIATNSPLTSVLLGIDPEATGGLAPTDFQYALKSQTIRSALVKDILYLDDGRMLLVYGYTLPKHTPPAIDAVAPDADHPHDTLSFAGIAGPTELPDCPSVFLVCSEDEGKHWGSPKVKRPTLANVATDDEWSLPLALIRDFTYAGSVFESSRNRLLVFGYVNETGSKDASTLSLAMYAIGLATLKAGPTTATAKASYAVKPTTTSAAVAYMRPPQVVYPSPDVAPPANSPPTGSPVGPITPTTAGFIPTPAPPTNKPVGSISNFGDEMFIKIIGNGKANAEIVTADILQVNPIFPSISGSTIQILFQDNSTGDIRGVSSFDRGRTWALDGSVYARNAAQAPYLFPDNSGTILFYFQAETLYCKRIGVGPQDAAGRSGQAQVLYDTATPSVVVTGAAPQKITVQRNSDGSLSVYYILVNGELGASISRHGGQQWEVMPNW